MNTIFNTIKEELQWSERVDFLVKFTESLIKVKTVNLSEISKYFDPTVNKNAKLDKSKKRKTSRNKKA